MFDVTSLYPLYQTQKWGSTKYLPGRLQEVDRSALQHGRLAMADLERRLNGDKRREERDEPATPAIRDRVQRVVNSHWQTRQAPTTTHRQSLDLAQAELAALVQELAKLIEQDLAQLEVALEAAGAPWTPGRRLVP